MEYFLILKVSYEGPGIMGPSLTELKTVDLPHGTVELKGQTGIPSNGCWGSICCLILWQHIPGDPSSG